MTSTLAERLRQARDLRGFSQGEVADRVRKKYPEAEVSQQVISKLELGEYQTSGYLAHIADALSVHTDWLALEIGPRDRDQAHYQVSDPKLVVAVKIMEPMAEYQKDQVIKILDTLAQPPGAQASNG